MDRLDNVVCRVLICNLMTVKLGGVLLKERNQDIDGSFVCAYWLGVAWLGSPHREGSEPAKRTVQIRCSKIRGSTSDSTLIAIFLQFRQDFTF